MIRERELKGETKKFNLNQIEKYFSTNPKAILENTHWLNVWLMCFFQLKINELKVFFKNGSFFLIEKKTSRKDFCFLSTPKNENIFVNEFFFFVFVCL